VSRGYFGVAVYRPKIAKNIGSLWRTADVYGAAFLATVGHRYQHQFTDTMHTTKHTPLHHYTDIDDLIGHLPDKCVLVAVELHERAETLTTFDHPERALYLLGAENNGLPPEVMERCRRWVQIPTVRPQSLNVAVAGSIVVAHRHMAKGVSS
jgi:tRNA G18 (ribose-2'-O)-methylase SpoU